MKKKSWEDQQREKHGITAPKFTLYMNEEAKALMDRVERAESIHKKAEKEFKDAARETSAYKYGEIFDHYQKAREDHENALIALAKYVFQVYQSLSLRPEE